MCSCLGQRKVPTHERDVNKKHVRIKYNIFQKSNSANKNYLKMKCKYKLCRYQASIIVKPKLITSKCNCLCENTCDCIKEQIYTEKCIERNHWKKENLKELILPHCSEKILILLYRCKRQVISEINHS